MFEENEKLNSVLEEIRTLKERSKLLESILRHYDYDSKTFSIPKKWKRNILKDKLPSESPREFLFEKIKNCLTEEERYSFGIYE